MSEGLARLVADVIELRMHQMQEHGISTPRPTGLSDNGIVRLTIDDIGDIAALVVDGGIDHEQVLAEIAQHRERRSLDA